MVPGVFEEKYQNLKIPALDYQVLLANLSECTNEVDVDRV